MSVQVKGSGTIGGLDEGLVVSGIVTSSTQINVGSNIKLGNAGVVTATSFVGGLPITSGADNRVITASSASALNGEANLHFDGTSLAVGKSGSAGAVIDAYHATSNTIAQFESGDAGASIVLKDNATYSGIQQNGNDFMIESDPGGTRANSTLLFKVDGAERLRIDSSGRILIAAGAVATPKASVGGLDVSSGLYSIVMGGEANTGDGTPRANSATKEARLCVPHYTNAEEPLGAVVSFTQSGASYLRFGGGSSIVNAATEIGFYTAANTTTTSGTERLRIASNGQITFNTNTLTVSSGTSGDAKLIIEADTDNNAEGDNPSLIFKQDGGVEVTAIGHGLLSGDQNGLVLATSCTNGYMSFATGSTNGHTNATERLHIGNDGTVSVTTSAISAIAKFQLYGSGNAGDALADNLRFHHWGNSSGDYWDIGVNHGLNGSGNNIKSSNTLKGAGIRLNGKNGTVTLITSPASTSTQYEGLTQNENGYVTIPHQPCFQAVRTSGSTVSSGTYITFNAEDRDVGNHYNHTNGTFTAPIAGNYFFYIASIGHNNTSSVLRLYLRINNGNIGSGNDAHLRLDVQNGAAYASNASFTYIRYMNANDTARVYFSADNGSSTLYSGADYLKFGGYLIG